jgi:hypothetical protein
MPKTLVMTFYVLIFVAHIFLLYWMIYVLKNAGLMHFNTVMFHFIGLALFGGGLIMTSALGIKHIQKSEWKKKHIKK